MIGEEGQSVIEVLVSVFVIALIAVGILGLSVLTTRLLVEAERQVAALAIVNEYKEFIESLPYNDVGFVSPGAGEPAGVIAGYVETVVRNNQTYQLTMAIQYVDDPLTAETNDYKKVELLVEWPAASGAVRDTQVVTYISEKGEPKSCVSCPDSRSCDATTGICNPPVSVPPSPSGLPCTPGLLCDNGTLCPLAGLCPDAGTAIPLVDPQGDACMPGGMCASGALCPLSGVCPTASCPDWTCPAQNVCFSGFCYQEDWYDITFPSDDNTGPADSSPMVCKQDRCETSLDCPAGCQSSCQYIDSESFTGCGRWQVVRQCQTTWVPNCRAATAGGAVSSCRGGYNPGGNCPGLEECNPVSCPPPDPDIDPNRSWCANGKECNLTSSNDACDGDEDCASGEMCGASGACRTICADNAECSYYWGGWTQGCSVEVVAEGPAGCSEIGGSCTGSPGSCVFDGAPAQLTVNIDNVGPAEVLEGNFPDTTAVAFRVSLSQVVVDTLTVRVELQDGGAWLADNDYTGSNVTLTFNPGGPQSQVVPAEVIGDNIAEADEDFAAVVVRAISNAHDVQIGRATATVVIINDDLVSSPSPSPSP
ncbi:MAG: Calx-beta domain-containing protein [bacterium]